MKPLVTGELWEPTAPLLLRRCAQPKGGLLPTGDCTVDTGISRTSASVATQSLITAVTHSARSFSVVLVSTSMAGNPRRAVSLRKPSVNIRSPSGRLRGALSGRRSGREIPMSLCPDSRTPPSGSRA